MPGMGPGPACCCAGCTTTLCAQFCGVLMSGVLVEVLSGSTPVTSGVTTSTGCVVLTIPAAGTYNVTISITGFTTRTQSKALTCGGTSIVQFTAAPTLSLTDSNTTIVMTETTSFSQIWRGCYELAVISYAPDFGKNPSDACDFPSTIGAGNCDIFYQIDCGVTGGNGVWTMTRTYGACCWSAALNTPPFTTVYSSSGSLNLTTCLGGNEQGIESGTDTQAVLGFPFNITLTSSGVNCGAGSSTLFSPLGPTVSVNV